jgi:hypothetical protein
MHTRIYLASIRVFYRPLYRERLEKNRKHLDSKVLRLCHFMGFA